MDIRRVFRIENTIKKETIILSVISPVMIYVFVNRSYAGICDTIFYGIYSYGGNIIAIGKPYMRYFIRRITLSKHYSYIPVCVQVIKKT